MMKNKKIILGILALLVFGIVFISGCAEKECETDADCLTKTCFTAQCADNKCVYSSLNGKQPGCSEEVSCGGKTCKEGVCEVDYEKNCCGNKICEVGETYPECAADCPNCDDKNDCTVDEYDYHEQKCVDTIIPNVICCGNSVCELGETYNNCAQDCPNCEDDNKCTKDIYDYHKQECVNEVIIPCCGNGICDEDAETYSNCQKDCPNCDDNNKLTADSFNYETQECENIVTHYFIDDFEEGIQNWAFSNEEAWSTILEDGNTYLRGVSVEQAGLWKEWDNHILKFRFKRIDGSMHVDFRRSSTHEYGTKRYLVSISERVNGLREQTGENWQDLKDINLKLDKGWHTLEIRCYNDIINVYIDDTLIIKYKDTENPFLSGRVRFELHTGGVSGMIPEFLIDDVEIKVITEEDIVYP